MALSQNELWRPTGRKYPLCDLSSVVASGHNYMLLPLAANIRYNMMSRRDNGHGRTTPLSDVPTKTSSPGSVFTTLAYTGATMYMELAKMKALLFF